MNFARTPSLRAALAAFSLALLPLAACSSSGSSSSSATSSDNSSEDQTQYEENPINHTTTEADLATTTSKEPLKAEAATLYVNGLGCPLCATNIDMQLNRIKGIASTKVDLSTGKVDLAFVGPDRPSPKRLSDAVADAGFTLVKLETR